MAEGGFLTPVIPNSPFLTETSECILIATFPTNNFQHSETSKAFFFFFKDTGISLSSLGLKALKKG